MKKTFIFGALFSFALGFSSARADDEAEVLRAKAYVALANELYSMAQENSDTLADLLSSRGVNISGAGFTYTAAEQSLLNDYNNIASQAQVWYEKVFGKELGLATGEDFDLPLDYSFLRRDAQERWTVLRQGFLIGSHRRRAANLYAVNADFKTDIATKTSDIVSELRRLDTEARRLQNEYSNFRASQVDAAGNVIGVEESKLQAQNYSLDAQTQYNQYQSQVDSLSLQLKDEKNDLASKAIVFLNARTVLQTNWQNLYNVKATSPSAPDVVTVPATSESVVPAEGTFIAGQTLLIQASGRWLARGVIGSDCVGPLPTQNCYLPFDGTDPAVDTVWYLISQPRFNNSFELTTLANPTLPVTTLGVFFDALAAASVDTDGNGYYISTSDSLASSRGRGGSSYIFADGGSTSVGESRSKGQSVSAGLKSANSYLPSANVGSLVAVMSGPGLNIQQQQPFLVGLNAVIKIPSNATGPVSLGFIQNDVVGHHALNSGSLSVQITTSTEFANYLPAFFDWFNKDCTINNGNRENCGFKTIVSDLAYSTDPRLIAQAAISNFILTYPPELQPVPPLFVQLMTDAVNSSLSLAMANRDFDLAMSRAEQTQIARDTADVARQQTLEKINNTKSLIQLIQRQAVTASTKSALLAAGTSFYESELSNMDNLRGYLIARLKRYIQIAYDSVNYRYLSNLKLKGSSQPGFEGDFYYQALQALLDQVADDDINNDVLNPNRGYLIYQLTSDQLASLKSNGKTSFSLNPEQFFCQGYGIEDQSRIHIEKIGYLLDINPLHEQDFFTNPNIRRAALRTTHGNMNGHYDLALKPIDYYLNSQTKEIYGYSSRILTDYHSDYAELGDSNRFQRRSFQNTSYVTDWIVELLDRLNYNLSYLNGVKMVIYFSSVEASNGAVLKTCTTGPATIIRRGIWK